jgi:hypothetical protein
MRDIFESFATLRSWCEAERFKGWDPYDGLNSRIFQILPLRKSTFCRLAVIQAFKRNQVNLRKIAIVPKKYNTKGLALLLQGYCNLFHAVSRKVSLSDKIGDKSVILDKINELAELLVSLQSKGYSGACWGYDFDWQSRAFFLPANTPTVVATSFVVEALLNAYEITNTQRYKDIALSSSDFITKDLNRIQYGDNFMFSYSPLDHRAVYNATLLGSKTLSLIYHYTHNTDFKELAKKSIAAVCYKQNPDGSFPHSEQVGNEWRDNFHTGFKLESIAIYQALCNDDSFDNNINTGFAYWINNFFIKDKGIAKYYDTDKDNNLIDLHCTAQAIPTIYKTKKIYDSYNQEIIENILQWSINNMQDKRGYFYFQKRGKTINKIAYMRWPNAWMFYGMSYWIKFLAENEQD